VHVFLFLVTLRYLLVAELHPLIVRLRPVPLQRRSSAHYSLLRCTLSNCPPQVQSRESEAVFLFFFFFFQLAVRLSLQIRFLRGVLLDDIIGQRINPSNNPPIDSRSTQRVRYCIRVLRVLLTNAFESPVDALTALSRSILVRTRFVDHATWSR
jgi:hypothetical protein